MEYKNCKLCKCQFVNKKRGVGRNIYCSLNCLHKSKIKPKIDIKCSFCGKINAVNAKKAKSLTKTGLKFCDINCKNKAQGIGKILQPSHYGTNKDIKNKNCLCCNIDLIKNCKLFCSKKCQNNYDYNKFINNWKNKEISGNIKNQVLSVYIRRYMLDKFEHKCSKCGWNKVNQKTGKIPLTINHIDGNSNNSYENNLEVLCPNCHSLTPNYCSLNKGNGRDSRREYDKKMRINFAIET